MTRPGKFESIGPDHPISKIANTLSGAAYGGCALRILRLEEALRDIQLDAASVLDPENKPGYELREYAEQIHAMAAAALSSGEPIRNEEGQR